jgi:hypothetical protein
MEKSGQSRVIGLLGVGFDTEDQQIRITEADQYQVWMGSGETHGALQEICHRIDQAVQSSGRPLSDYSPEEFMELVQGLY